MPPDYAWDDATLAAFRTAVSPAAEAAAAAVSAAAKARADVDVAALLATAARLAAAERAAQEAQALRKRKRQQGAIPGDVAASGDEAAAMQSASPDATDAELQSHTSSRIVALEAALRDERASAAASVSAQLARLQRQVAEQAAALSEARAAADAAVARADAAEAEQAHAAVRGDALQHELRYTAQAERNTARSLRSAQAHAKEVIEAVPVKIEHAATSAAAAATASVEAQCVVGAACCCGAHCAGGGGRGRVAVQAAAAAAGAQRPRQRRGASACAAAVAHSAPARAPAHEDLPALVLYSARHRPRRDGRCASSGRASAGAQLPAQWCVRACSVLACSPSMSACCGFVSLCSRAMFTR